MTSIKVKIKGYGITLAELAQKLEISRPTLDSYINTYEKGEKIAKDKYQTIFNSLFSEDISCKEDFTRVLNYSEELIEKDRVLGIEELDINKTDILDSVISEMKSDMLSHDYDEDIYIFINMIIRSYKKEEIFKKLARYFLILNGKKALDNIKGNEIYLSNYYKLFYEDKTGKLKRENKYLEKLYDRSKEIREKQKEYQKKMEKKIIEELEVKFQEKINLGIDAQDINIYDLLNAIYLKDKV